LIDEFEVRLMDECSRVQRVILALTEERAASHAPELVVNER
jgi:hypothetical protein